tara:strand:- start:241 stop:462 length:222 start_codon:yes stop_codon:yes gene_type:complete
MALSSKVSENLKEAEGSLRNALHWAAKNERPLVCKRISDLIHMSSQIGSFDGIMDTLDKMDNKFEINFDDDLS